MKKTLTAIFITAIFLTAQAVRADDIKIILNGSRLNLDAPPIKKSGTVFVPMRKIFEGLNASVNYQKSAGRITARKGRKLIVLTIGDSCARVDGFRHRLLSPPFVGSGNTYVPLRFISESMGCDVNWHPPTNTVRITQKAKPETSPKSGNSLNDVLKDQVKGYLKNSGKAKPKNDSKITPIRKSGIDKIKPIEKNSPAGKSKPDEDDDDIKIDDMDLDDDTE